MGNNRKKSIRINKRKKNYGIYSKFLFFYVFLWNVNKLWKIIK